MGNLYIIWHYEGMKLVENIVWTYKTWNYSQYIEVLTKIMEIHSNFISGILFTSPIIKLPHETPPDDMYHILLLLLQTTSAWLLLLIKWLRITMQL